MGRVKAFDESAVLRKAMLLFWRQGYSNTTLKQLLAETGMLNGSFYHYFQDKQTVFLRSLDFYNQDITHKRQVALLSHDDFSQGIRALFSEIFITLEDDSEPNGCLIVNSMVEEVLCEPVLKTFLLDDFSQFVAFMANRLQHSIDLQFTSTHLPADELALLLVTYIHGLFRISNTNADTALLKSQTEHFLFALGL